MPEGNAMTVAVRCTGNFGLWTLRRSALPIARRCCREGRRSLLPRHCAPLLLSAPLLT